MTQFVDEQDRELEEFFEAARGSSPVPSDDFLARVLADAADIGMQPQTVPLAQASKQAGWLSRLGDHLSFWTLPGAATACIALGLLAGYTVPSTESGADALSVFFDYGNNSDLVLPGIEILDYLSEG